MTLYVIRGDDVALSGSRFDPVLGTEAVRYQLASYGSLVWRRDGLVFSLISDASDEEMTAFAAVLPGREAGRPAAGGEAVERL